MNVLQISRKKSSTLEFSVFFRSKLNLVCWLVATWDFFLKKNELLWARYGCTIPWDWAIPGIFPGPEIRSPVNQCFIRILRIIFFFRHRISNALKKPAVTTEYISVLKTIYLPSTVTWIYQYTTKEFSIHYRFTGDDHGFLKSEKNEEHSEMYWRVLLPRQTQKAIDD